MFQYDRWLLHPTICGQWRRDAHPAVTESLAILVLKINGRVQQPTKPQAAPRALPKQQQEFEKQQKRTGAFSALTTTFLLTLMMRAQSTLKHMFRSGVVSADHLDPSVRRHVPATDIAVATEIATGELTERVHVPVMLFSSFQRVPLGLRSSQLFSSF